MSLRTRFILIFGLGSVFFLFIVTLLVFSYMEAAMEKQLKQQFEIDSHNRFNNLTSTFEKQTERFVSTATLPLFRSMRFNQLTLNTAAYKNDIRQMELYFQDWMQQNEELLKINFINDKALEVFRVEQSGIKRNLSDMSQETLVTKLLARDELKIYVSKNELNTKNESFTWWIPVNISTNKHYGIISFNVRATAILSQIKQLVTTQGQSICLTDKDNGILLTHGHNNVCHSNVNGLWIVSEKLNLPGLEWTLNLSTNPDTFLSEVKQIKQSVFFIIFPIIAILAFTFSYIFSSQILQAIFKLVNAARIMGRGNKLEKLDLHRNDELGELAKEMNRSAAMIETHRYQLEEKNRDLEAYSYTLAHDLRTPLRSIISFSQILKEDASEKLSDEDNEFLSRIINSSKRMAMLLNDILELSRISNYEIKVQNISFSQLANEIVTHFQEIHPLRNVKIDIENNLNVNADPQLMRLILENIIGNAWKYTSNEEFPSINIGSTVKDGHKILYISDNGVGFEMQYVNKLFKPFSRLHTNDEFEGTGIGLASVKRLIEKHEGEVWVESAPNQGTTMYFTLWQNQSLK